MHLKYLLMFLSIENYFFFFFLREYILRRYYDKKRKQSGKQHAADEGRRMPYLHRWQSVMLLHKIKSKIKVSKINGLGP